MRTRRARKPDNGSLALRLVVWALLLGIAAVTAGLQLDRQTRLSPQLFAVVPGPFKSQALVPEAELAVSRKLPVGYELAQTLVSRRPVPAEGLTLLSLASVEAGEDRLADDAMAVAASRGWRVTVANLLALGGAYAAGDYEGAVLRLAALGRMQAGDEINKQGIAIIAASAEGRAALVDYARRDSSMANMLLRNSLEALPPEQAVQLVRDTKEAGGKFDCANTRWIVTGLLRLGRGVEAVDLWDKDCSEAEEGATDGAQLAFDATDPFAWQLQRAPGLSRSTRSDHVRFRNKDPLERVVAQRFLLMPAGKYRMEAITQTSSKPAASRAADLQLGVRCRPESRRRMIDPNENTFTVDEKCPVQELTLHMGRGEARVEKVVIERFR